MKGEFRDETVDRFLRLLRVCGEARIPDMLIGYAELNQKDMTKQNMTSIDAVTQQVVDTSTPTLGVENPYWLPKWVYGQRIIKKVW